MSREKSGGCACTALKKASRAVTRYYEDLMRPAGLTTSQFALLRALEREGPTPMTGLAEHLVMDRTSLYRCVKPLLRDGLVLRRASRRDGRVREAVLSASGRRKIRETLPYWERAQRSFLADFGASRWRTTAGSLRRVVALARDRGAGRGAEGRRW